MTRSRFFVERIIMTSPRILKACLTALVLIGSVRADDQTYARELKEAGHSVKLDRDGHLVGLTLNKSENLTDADYQRLGTLMHLKQLTFYGNCKMTDANAEHIGKLATLEELAINGTALSDDGFKHLGKLAQLRKLIFWHLGWQKVPITGSGFAELASCPKLETFGFAGSTIGDDGLKALARVKQLKHLELYHTRVTDAGLAHLKALADLRSINVGPQFSMRLGDAGLATLATIPTLEKITYGETILTFDGSLKNLKDLKQLKALVLTHTDVLDTDLQKLKTLLPEVKIEQTPPEAKLLEQMRQAAAKRRP
jgi:hypothetical protein